MARASSTSRLPAPVRVGWHRSRRRRWARPNDLAAATALFGVLPSLPRAALARLTAHMIDADDDDQPDPVRQQEKVND